MMEENTGNKLRWKESRRMGKMKFNKKKKTSKKILKEKKQRK